MLGIQIITKHDINGFFRTYFDLRVYITVLAFIGLSIWANQYFGIRDFMFKDTGKFIVILYHIPFYALSYFTVFFISVFCSKHKLEKPTAIVLLKAFLFVCVLSFHSGFYLNPDHFFDLNNTDERYYFHLLAFYAKYIITLFIPILVFYFLFERQQKTIYGFTVKSVNLKSYIMLFLVVLPVVVVASFHPSFLYTYPIFKSWESSTIAGMNKWQMILLFELFYGLNFVFIEWWFRGTMILSFPRQMQGHAILAMTATYCFLHFGKPVGEVIGSIFGGYLLGIFVYYSHSIVGGIIIHLGIAYSMEIVANIHHL